MNSKEIRNVLTSAFLDAELGVRVINSHSTSSLYLTASNDRMPFTVRVANHRNSPRFSTVHDYWIDTSKEDTVSQINRALQAASKRFNIPIPAYQTEPVVAAPAVKNVGKSSVNYSMAVPQNLIDVAYRACSGHLAPVCRTRKVVAAPTAASASASDKNVLRFLWVMGIVLILFYLWH
jgi:hypothetical protein